MGSLGPDPEKNGSRGPEATFTGYMAHVVLAEDGPQGIAHTRLAETGYTSIDSQRQADVPLMHASASSGVRIWRHAVVGFPSRDGRAACIPSVMAGRDDGALPPSWPAQQQRQESPLVPRNSSNSLFLLAGWVLDAARWLAGQSRVGLETAAAAAATMEPAPTAAGTVTMARVVDV